MIHPDDMGLYGAIPSLENVRPPVFGGTTRQASVHAGLEALAKAPPVPDVVLIHDAARPFATAELVTRALACATATGTAIPALPVTDAVILARRAEGVVLVVKGHDTPRELVRRARDQLQQAGARLLGVVVNNVDLGWGDVYFYRQYFGAYYGTPAVAGERA